MRLPGLGAFGRIASLLAPAPLRPKGAAESDQGGGRGLEVGSQDLDDAAHRRYNLINLPHARTIGARIERTLEALGAFGEVGDGHAAPLRETMTRLGRELEPFDEDPPAEEALRAADAVAVHARALASTPDVKAIGSEPLGAFSSNSTRKRAVLPPAS